MSFAAGGADCGPSNPMTGLLKQFGQDRSIQQDRFIGPRQGESSMAGFRSKAAAATNTSVDRQFADEFLQDSPVAGPAVDTFAFHDIRHELAQIDPASAGQQEHANWASDFLHHQQHNSPQTFDHDPQLEEFEAIYQQQQAKGASHTWREEFATFQEQASKEINLTSEEKAAFDHAFDVATQGAALTWDKEFEAQTSWAAEFTEREEQSLSNENDDEALAQTAAKLLDSIDVENNPKFRNSQFMQLMQKLSTRQVSVQGDKMVETQGKEADWASEFSSGKQPQQQQQQQRDWTDDFLQHAAPSSSGNMWSSEFAAQSERGWSESLADNATPTQVEGDWQTQFAQNQANTTVPSGPAAETESWMEQYQRNIAHLKTTKDAEWDTMQKEWDTFGVEQGEGYRATRGAYDNYVFATDNPYFFDPGLISQAQDSVLALEARVQLSMSDASAWHALGVQQQKSERDVPAIAALRQAVKLDPSRVDAWLGLAVSYANENYRLDAYDCLQSWLAHHPDYQSLASDNLGAVPVDRRHTVLVDRFLQAARSAGEAAVDADVQVCLGILFNMSQEYDKAVDCFKTALQSRPEDDRLWNKLGATLANAGDTSGAIEAYFHALELNPSYIRARYNLAISCIGLNQFNEAAEHLLAAISQQQQEDTSTPTDNTGMNDNVWDCLRIVMGIMMREDLAEACRRRDIDAFRGTFTF